MRKMKPDIIYYLDMTARFGSRRQEHMGDVVGVILAILVTGGVIMCRCSPRVASVQSKSHASPYNLRL